MTTTAFRPRRAVLLGMALAPAMLRPAVLRAATHDVPVELGTPVTVASSRLDALAATWHATFNAGEVLRRFDPATQGARGDVRLFRLVTTVVVPETAEPVKVSGLLALPAGATGRVPVVSWQHGTIFGTKSVPSNLTRIADPAFVMQDGTDSAETLFMLQRLVANGFAVIGADYLGKGPIAGGRPEAYLVREASVATCRAVLDAGLAAMDGLGLEAGPLFLHGWSQGGLNTQWLAQALERDGRPIRAAAAASPFNDLNETMRWWAGDLAYPAPDGAAYPAVPAWASLAILLVLGSYQSWYGMDGLIEAAVRPDYHDIARGFWPSETTNFDTTRHFPTPAELLTEDFFHRHTAEVVSSFLRRMAANRATYDTHATPLRLFHGLADEALHPALVRQALASGGAQVDGAAVPRASHRITFLASVYGSAAETGGKPDVLTWFRDRLAG